MVKPFLLDRYVCVALLCWLLKDAGWVMLIPGLAWPAAGAAVLCESHSFLMRFAEETTAQRVHGVATFAWLLGNTFWMVAEFLFEPVPECGRQMPWFSAPLAINDLAVYERALRSARAILVFGLMVLGLFYAKCLVDGGGGASSSAENSQDASALANPQDEEPQGDITPRPLVFGLCTPEVYQWVFIGPWILKDIFWSMEILWPAVICGLVVVAFTVDYIRRYGGFIFAAEMFWVVGNIIWIFGELYFNDGVYWPRIVTAAFLVVGVLLVFAEFRQTFATKESEPPHEASHLLAKNASSATSPSAASSAMH